jgi:hypothetical protein
VTDPRRRVPRTGVVLAEPRLAKAAQVLGPALVKGYPGPQGSKPSMPRYGA